MSAPVSPPAPRPFVGWPPRRAALAVALAAWLVAPSDGAWAQADPCAGTLAPAAIVGCLRPDATGGATRGIRPAGPQAAPTGTAAAPGAPRRPAPPEPGAGVNLTVTFGFDSAELTPEGGTALAALAQALRDPALAEGRFLIAGHTDAAGGAAHNRALSERRAATARRFLVEQGGVDPGRLSTIGFGASRLYDSVDPLSAANRRVQVSRL